MNIDYYIANPNQVTQEILKDFSIKDKRLFLHYAVFVEYEWLNKEDFDFYLKHNVNVLYRQRWLLYDCIGVNTDKKYKKCMLKHYLKMCEAVDLESFFEVLSYILNNTKVNEELYNIIKSKKIFNRDECFWEKLMEYRFYLNCNTLLKNIIDLYKIFPKNIHIDNAFDYLMGVNLDKYKGKKINDYNIIKNKFKRNVDNLLSVLRNFVLTEEEEKDIIQYFNITHSKKTLKNVYDYCTYENNKKYIEKFLFIKSIE